MAIPQQVQAQADKAEELLKASQQEPPAGAADPNSPESLNAKPSDGVKPEETVEYWKQRFEVIQGKYNSEIQPLKDDVNLLTNLKSTNRQLSANNQELTGKLAEANRTIEDLKKQAPANPAQPAAEAKQLTEEDREYLRGEGFDDKTIDIILKVQASGAPQKQDHNEIAEIKQEMQQQKVATFWEKLTDAVPDWEPLNKSDAFLDWLELIPAGENKTRQQAIKDAQSVLDYRTVIKIFQDFKREKPAAAQEKKPEHQIDPAKQIEPASSAAHIEDPQGGKPQGKVYTRKDIAEFYRDVSIGKYRGREDEQKRIDADILLANQQGRIQG